MTTGYVFNEYGYTVGSDGIRRCNPCNDGKHNYCAGGECKCLCLTEPRREKVTVSKAEQGTLADFLDRDAQGL